MKPIRTPDSNTVFALPGGNEDNYLYAQNIVDGIRSVWEPTPEERALIAGGASIVLVIFGALVPPVGMTVERPWCRLHRAQMTWEQGHGYACETCAAAAASDE